MSNFTTHSSVQEAALIQESISQALTAAQIPAMTFPPTTRPNRGMVVDVDIPHRAGSLADVAAQVEGAFAADVEIDSISNFIDGVYTVTLRIIDVAALLAAEEQVA